MPVLPHIHSQSTERLFIVEIYITMFCGIMYMGFVETFKLLRYHLCDVSGLYFVVYFFFYQHPNEFLIFSLVYMSDFSWVQ